MCRIPSKLLFSCRNLQKEFAEGSSHLSKGQEVRAARFDVNKELPLCHVRSRAVPGSGGCSALPLQLLLAVCDLPPAHHLLICSSVSLPTALVSHSCLGASWKQGLLHECSGVELQGTMLNNCLTVFLGENSPTMP